MKPDWHYFEAHITAEPVFGERLEQFKTVCGNWLFRVADLLMQKREQDIPERSKYDTFCTGRSSNYSELLFRTVELIKALKESGFKVWRYKIESTVIDSKYHDKFNLVEK